jgi:hypothetical protein
LRGAPATKQSIFERAAAWIASLQGLLAMTGKQLYFMGCISSQALRIRSDDVDMTRTRKTRHSHDPLPAGSGVACANRPKARWSLAGAYCLMFLKP